MVCTHLRVGWTTCLESARDISSALCNACSSVCSRTSKNTKYAAQLDEDTVSLIWGRGGNDFLTMPAWKDAEGATTFCADTEVGIRWAELEKESERDREGEGKQRGG